MSGRSTREQAAAESVGTGGGHGFPGGATTGHATTGHAEVDEAIAALAAVRDAPPGDQVAALGEAHRVLAETLDTIGDV